MRSLCLFTLTAGLLLNGNLSCVQAATPENDLTSDKTGVIQEQPPIELAQNDPQPQVNVTSNDPWDNPIITDRPYFSGRPYTVPKGSIQLETGYTYEHFSDYLGVDSLDFTFNAFPQALARVGVTPSTEVRLGLPSYLIRKTEFLGSSLTQGNFGDSSVAIRQGLGHLPGDIRLAAQAGTIIPIGSETFSGDKFLPSISLLMERKWRHVMLNGRLLGFWPVDNFNDYFFQFRPSVGVTYNFNRRFSLFTEYMGIIASEGKSTHYVQHGLRLLATPRQQLDMAVGYGLNNAASDIFITAGYSFRIDGLFKRIFH